MKCGCASTTCNCAVKAGTNTTVTGNGSPGSPYVISATVPPAVTVLPLDTASVDMVVTGGPAYTVSANVIKDPVAGNILNIGPAGLSVLCSDVITCVPAVTAGAGIAVTGGTSAADPYVVSATGAGVPVTVAPLDTNSINTTVTGGPNYIVSADVIRDPEANNLLTIGAAGVDVQLHTDCGLDGAGTLADPLLVSVSGTPNDNPQAPITATCQIANGQHVYCDPATGDLYGPPQQDRRVGDFTLTSVNGSVELNAIGVPIGGPPAVFGPTFAGVFTNPNPCREMVVTIQGGVKHFNMRADTGGRTQFQFGLQLTLTGPAAGVYAPNGGHVQFMADGNRGGNPDPNWDFIWDTVATTQYVSFVLAPGASFNWTMQGIAQLTNYNGDSQVNTLLTFIHIDGQTV